MTKKGPIFDAARENVHSTPFSFLCLSCFHHMANQNVLLTHFANCKQGQRAFVGNNENVEGSELVYYSVYP